MTASLPVRHHQSPSSPGRSLRSISISPTVTWRPSRRRRRSCQLASPRPLTPSQPLTFDVGLKAAASDAPWNAGLITPLKWGLAAGFAALILGGLYALLGCGFASETPPADPKKILPGGKTTHLLPWSLPAKPVSGIDFGASGTAGKLVFLGATITAILALGDQLDSMFSDQQQLVLAVTNIVALLIAGTAPLALFGFQARYTPTMTVNGQQVPIADEQLVASVPGVVLGKAGIAAAIGVQIAALNGLGGSPRSASRPAGCRSFSESGRPCITSRSQGPSRSTAADHRSSTSQISRNLRSPSRGSPRLCKSWLPFRSSTPARGAFCHSRRRPRRWQRPGRTSGRCGEATTARAVQGPLDRCKTSPRNVHTPEHLPECPRGPNSPSAL